MLANREADIPGLHRCSVDAQSRLAPLHGSLALSCLPALGKCSSSCRSTLSSPHIGILPSLISHLRTSLTTQSASVLPSYDPGGQRRLLVFTPCAVRDLYRSCLPGQSLSSLRVGASCLISPAFLALGIVPYLVLDFIYIKFFFKLKYT